MSENSKYGVLLDDAIKLHRQYFEEMVELLGIKVKYRAIKPGKFYTVYTEIDANYEPEVEEGCIFDDHPSQQTLKKIGWVSELQEGASIIHVRYDLPGLQQGALFSIPSGLDTGTDRLFRVTKLSTSMVYPASIVCEVVPEYINTYNSGLDNFEHRSFTLLNGEEEDYQ